MSEMYQRMQLFWVAAILHPTIKEFEDDGAIGEVIVAPKCLMASNEAQASTLLGRELPAEKVGMVGHRLEVVVRPF